MKPKYKQTLGEFIRYYHINCNEYTVKIYVNGRLAFNKSIQSAYTFGHDYLNVTEFFRNPNTKTITVYTSEY